MPRATRHPSKAWALLAVGLPCALSSCALLGTLGRLGLGPAGLTSASPSGGSALATEGPTPSPSSSFTWISLPSPTPTATPLPLTLYGLSAGGQLWVQLSWSQGGSGSIVEKAFGQNIPQGTHDSGWIDQTTYSPAVTFAVQVASGSLYQGTLGPVAPPACSAGGGGGGGGSSGPTNGCAWAQTTPGITPYQYFKDGITPPTESSPVSLSWTDSTFADGYLLDFGTAVPNSAPPPPLTFSGKPVAWTAQQTFTVGATGSLPGVTDQAPFEVLLASASLMPQAWPSLTSGVMYGWSLQPVLVGPDRHSVAIGPQTPFPLVFKAS